MKQILVFIFDGYADWEPAYVCAQLNAPATGYAVKTIGLDRAPKVSMGGFRVTPDFTVADYPRDAGLLLLTGGTAWLERKNDAVLPVVRELVRCHIPVAAICNAVNFLAENGFLDQRRHTGNTLPFLKSQAPHYKGEAYFVEAEAVCDNGILTANGFGALELAKEILRLLGSFFHIAMNGMSASDKIFRILDMEEEADGTQSLTDGPISADLRHVAFSYNMEKPVLREISMTIPAGSFVSLVGVSGCGKSTVSGLLTGKLRQTSGEIRINQIPLTDIKERDLMQSVTLIRHNSYLFKGTVRDNLLMGNPDASESQMKEALEKVRLLDFLDGQKGLDTELDEQGNNFSGGQRQRLAIARALLHNTPMYILDEAASNIDVESEDQIMEVVRELAKTKTVLFISHRLANVTASDCIYMMENGMISESGTHEELMRQNGSYAAMFRRQQDLCKIRGCSE